MGFFGLVDNVRAATYYVNATGGLDSNDGTSSTTPWLTLNKADSAAATGDVIYVATGTYIEDDPSTHGWRVSKGITWIAQGEVIVKGTVTSIRPLYISAASPTSFDGFTIDAEGKSYAIYLTAAVTSINFTNGGIKNSATYLVYVLSGLSNIVITNSQLNTSSGRVLGGATFYNAIFDNNSINFVGVHLFFTNSGSSNIEFTNNTVVSTTSSFAFYIYGDGVYEFNGNNIEITLVNTLFKVYSSGSLNISNNTISATGTIVSLLEAKNRYIATSTLTFSDNVINILSRTASDAIYVLEGTWTPIINNNVVTAYSDELGGAVIRLDNVYSPIITNNTIETFSTEPATHISILSTGSTTPSVDIGFNTLRTRSSEGYAIDIGTESTSSGDEKINGINIHNNSIYGPLYYNQALTGVTIHSIFVGFNANPLIHHNYINGGGYGLVLKANGLSYVEGSVYSNLFINNGYITVRVKGVNNANIHSNTIYSEIPSSSHFNISSNSGVGPVESIFIKNNIMSGLVGVSLLVDVDSTSVELSEDYNCIVMGIEGNFVEFGSLQYSLFSDWQGTGRGLHDCSQNASFVNATNNNFQQTYLSPSIDSGTTIPGFTTSTTTDYAGNPIYGTPDIGAYEYQPPYTIGTHNIDPTGNIRIYADGKYRYTTSTSSTMSANLRITPNETWTYTASTTRPEWLNISNITWNTDTKQWTASSNTATTTIYTIGDLTPNVQHTISVDGVLVDTKQSDTNGSITYTYTGGYSTHTFSITPIIRHTSGGRGYIAGSPYAPIVPTITSTPTVSTTTLSTTTIVYTFPRNLSLNMSGPDVLLLQKYLNTHNYILATTGPGSPGNETSYFGSLTRRALIKYQIANRITPAVGYFGPITRGVLKDSLKK